MSLSRLSVLIVAVVFALLAALANAYTQGFTKQPYHNRGMATAVWGNKLFFTGGQGQCCSLLYLPLCC
jgi:hypothetical protein